MLKEIGNDDFGIITVPIHKTVQTHGPSNIVVSNDLVPVIKNLLKLNELLHSDIDNEAEERGDRGKGMLFVSSYGCSISASDVNRYTFNHVFSFDEKGR